jgi:GAF domain-containing protein/HAMP domain-containing protein
LTVLFLFFSMIPISMVFVFVQWQLRENLINAQLEVAAGHAQIYFSNLEDALDRQQEIQEVTETMTQSAAGEEYALIAGNGTYLAHSRAEKVGRSALEDFSFSVLQKMLARKTTALVDMQKGYLIGAYRTSLTSPLAVTIGSVTEKTAELNALTRSLLIQLFSAVLLISLAGGAAVLLTLRPLVKLANYANDLSQGNLDLQFDDRTLKGELAVLSASLKRLAASVQTSIASLEKRVDERTAELERRSKLLKAVADVGKAITSFRELSELLQQTAHLIHENFGYYHVGIFLLDDHKEYATLAAANSEGGQKMLERKHQLKVGETSIVGYVTKNAQARIALDVGKDAVFFDNPDLPETRSEMALPLVAGGQTLGALDVQSTEPEAFSEEDISTLQILAEQIAIAIQNANLFNEARKALDAARISYAEQSREAWSKILRNQPRIGFLATPPSTTQTQQSERLASNLAKAIETGDIIYDNDGLTISVPVKVRGQVIGAIRMKKSEIADAWTQDEVNLALALSDQLSGALESARLYREAQQLAARESLISDISTRISAVSQTDAILRETVQELGQNLNGASVTFHLVDSFFEPQTRSKEKPASAWGGGKGAA